MWAKVRAYPSVLTPFDDVIPTLWTLKERGLIVGLISNIYQDLDALCDNMKLSPYLDFKVSSRTAGAEKPHARFSRRLSASRGSSLRTRST